MIKFLLEKNKSTINKIGMNFNTALHIAVSNRNYKAVETLLSFGANKSMKNSNNLNSIELAKNALEELKNIILYI